ncbi:MAG: hypothetical protein IK115_03560 [Lachnospiraceae bacterium]|nr:hypothetical protein [Lachnospiraceae bacterium]
MSRKEQELLRKQQEKQQLIAAEEEQQKELFSQSMLLSFQSQRQEDAPAAPVLVRDVQRSQSLLAKCKKKIFPASAGDVAEGTPVQAPVQERGFKQRRKDAKHEKQLRKTSTLKCIDYGTWNVLDAMQTRQTAQTNSVAAIKKTVPGFSDGHGDPGVSFDSRIVMTYMTGYLTDKNGDPLNEEEAKKRDADIRLAEDYASADLQRRTPFLRKITDELLNLNLDISMFSEEYMSAHYGEMQWLSDKLMMYENLMRDPGNKAFFDDMEPLERQLLETRALSFAGVIGTAVNYFGTSKGVSMNTRKLMGSDPAYDDHARETGEKYRERYIPRIADMIKKRDADEKQIYAQAQAESFRKALKAAENPNPDLSGTPGGTDTFKEMHKGLQDVQGRKAVADSDAKYQEGRLKGNMREANSGGFMALGIRHSSNKTAVAYDHMLGSMFTSLTADYHDLYHGLKEQGIPIAQMEKMISKESISRHSAMRFATGGGVEALGHSVLSLFRKRVDSDQFVSFLEDSYVLYGGAQVFEGDLKKFVGFHLQELLTTKVGALKSEAPPDMLEYVNSCVMNLMALPRLQAEITGERREEMAQKFPELLELLDEYTNMVDTITAKLQAGAKNEPTETGAGSDKQSFVSKRGAAISDIVQSASLDELAGDVAVQKMCAQDFVLAYQKKIKDGTAPDLEGGSVDDLAQVGEVRSLLRVMYSMIPDGYVEQLMSSSKGDVFEAVTQIGNDLRFGGPLQALGDLAESCKAAFNGSDHDTDEDASALMVNLLMKQVILPAMAVTGDAGEEFAEQLKDETEIQSRSEEYRDRGWLLQSLNTHQRQTERDKDFKRKQDAYAEEQRQKQFRDQIAALDAQFADKAAKIADDAHDFKVDFIGDQDKVFASKKDFIVYMRSITATPEMLANNPLLQKDIVENFNDHFATRINSLEKIAFRKGSPEISSLNALLQSMCKPDYMRRILEETGVTQCQRVANERKKNPDPVAAPQEEAAYKAAIQTAIDRITADLGDGGELEPIRKVLEKLGPAFSGTGMDKEDGSMQSAMLINTIFLRVLTLDAPEGLSGQAQLDYTTSVVASHGALMREINTRATAVGDKGGDDALVGMLKDKFRHG